MYELTITITAGRTIFPPIRQDVSIGNLLSAKAALRYARRQPYANTITPGVVCPKSWQREVIVSMPRFLGSH